MKYKKSEQNSEQSIFNNGSSEMYNKISVLRIKKKVFQKMIRVAKEYNPKEYYGFMFGNEINFFEDAYVPPAKYQRVTGTSVDIDVDDMSKIKKLKEYREKEANNKYSLGWFHSHAGMAVFFSGTDDHNQEVTLYEGIVSGRAPHIIYKEEKIPWLIGTHFTYEQGRFSIKDDIGFGVSMLLDREGRESLEQLLHNHLMGSVELISPLITNLSYGLTVNIRGELYGELWTRTNLDNLSDNYQVDKISTEDRSDLRLEIKIVE